MRKLFLFLLLAGCTRRYVPCNDTLSCREQALQREAALARAVAQEPAVLRLEVETVSRLALVDPQRRLVYALDPGLVALDLQTGEERWRVDHVAGDALWRVGESLAVSTDPSSIPPTVAFVDPRHPEKPTRCTISLGAPKEADHVYVHLFDRFAQPYGYWMSAWTYRGGAHPGEAAETRERTAKACGVVKIDPQSCALKAEALSDFLWDPPEGRPAEPCALSPMRDLPAAVASAPKVQSNPSLALGAYETLLRVTTSRLAAGNSCTETTQLTLEAHSPAGELLWKHPLEDRKQDVCKPP